MNHEALAIVEVDPGEEEPEARLPLERPGRVARQNVDLPLAQCSEALGRRERHESYLGRIAENGGRNRAADIDIEATPGIVRLAFRKAEQALADAADQHASLTDRINRRCCCRRERQRAKQARQRWREAAQHRGNSVLHFACSPFIPKVRAG